MRIFHVNRHDFVLEKVHTEVINQEHF